VRAGFAHETFAGSKKAASIKLRILFLRFRSRQRDRIGLSVIDERNSVSGHIERRKIEIPI
jgi:hypothetical protein